MRNVVVDYRKWPAQAHYRYEAVELGRDSFGTWLGAPIGTAIYRDNHHAHDIEDPWIVLVPNEGWWVATWVQHHDIEIYVDIVTPPDWHDDRLVMIDLDVDLIRHRSGKVDVLDEAEFATNRVLLGYPGDVVKEVGSTTMWLKLELQGRNEPFGAASLPWMTQLVPPQSTGLRKRIRRR